MNYFRYNIKEHNHILFSSFKASENRTSFWKSLWSSFKWTLKNLVKERKSLRKIFRQPNTNPIIFISETSNNTRTLRPIWEKLDENTYTVLDGKNLGAYFPRLRVFLCSLVYAWPLIKTYLRASKSEKEVIETFFNSFFYTVAYVKLSAKILRVNKVRLVIMANDHSTLQRSFLMSARTLNVATIYTQHCSVTERFPFLQFTYSFLDGEESYIKYATIGNVDSNVYLSGSPRFDEIAIVKKCLKKDSDFVGVALNLLDNETKVKDLCLFMKHNGFEKIIVRPHPRQTVDRKWYVDNNFFFSDSKNESPFEFISSVGILVSGESGIHLDAILMGVPSICVDMSGNGLVDWYSYIKNGLVPYAKDEEELICLLQGYRSGNLKIKRDIVGFYNASSGSVIEGNVGNMIADFINYFMDNSIDEFDKKYNFAKKKICKNMIKVLV